MPYKIRGDVEVERDLLVNRNVGVNTSAPTEKLEVLGTAKVSELIVSGQGQSYKLPVSAGVSGQYIISNGNGNTTYWGTPFISTFSAGTIGTGQSILKSYNNAEIVLRTLSQQGTIQISAGSRDIIISAATKPVTLSAQGTGANLFLGISGGTELRYRTIIGSNIEVSAGANEIIISALTQNVTLSSLGGGTSLAIGVSANREVQIRSLTAGGAVDITTSSNTINISARAGVSTITLSAGRGINVSNSPLTGNGTIDISTNLNVNFTGVSADNIGVLSATTVQGRIGINKSPATGISIDINGTGAIRIPVGTTAQRPSSPGNGMIRYNSSHKWVEFYGGQGPDWNPIGQWNYLGQYNLSTGTTNHTSFDGDDLREYEEILIHLYGVGSTTNNSGLRINLYINGTVITSNDYYWVRHEVSGNQNLLNSSQESGTNNLIPLTGSNLSSNSARTHFGTIHLMNIARTGFRTDVRIATHSEVWGIDGNGKPHAHIVRGIVSANNLITGVRYTTTAGNLFGAARYFGKRGY